ncbi:hypothetical protein OPV22_033309 [Ensete ventricosum]|uniref:Uncharacterized protein n=1 Tax=Ensete ventricosum TaxID=4639 RepID=A0AAV8Q102_ENSVE|nr:hypothetical protein OPV22_033309 [Ensete ventricosum]
MGGARGRRVVVLVVVLVQHMVAHAAPPLLPHSHHQSQNLPSSKLSHLTGYGGMDGICLLWLDAFGGKLASQKLQNPHLSLALTGNNRLEEESQDVTVSMHKKTMMICAHEWQESMIDRRKPNKNLSFSAPVQLKAPQAWNHHHRSYQGSQLLGMGFISNFPPSNRNIDPRIEAFSSPPLSLCALQSLIKFGAQQEDHMGFIEVVSQIAKPALDVHGQCFHVHMQWSLPHLGTTGSGGKMRKAERKSL